MAASLPEGSSSPYSSSRALYASPALLQVMPEVSKRVRVKRSGSYLSLALVPLFQPYSGVHAAKEAANVEMTTFCDRKRRLLQTATRQIRVVLAKSITHVCWHGS
eukprot:492146-Rhodomonas_salina.1